MQYLNENNKFYQRDIAKALTQVETNYTSEKCFSYKVYTQTTQTKHDALFRGNNSN